jgi:dihydrofolate reductase
VRPGGTTCYFVNDGPESALEQARASAGGRDIRISGGAKVIQQYLSNTPDATHFRYVRA